MHYYSFLSLYILQLYVNGEKFNQPIFACNNISGFVEPVSNTFCFPLSFNLTKKQKNPSKVVPRCFFLVSTGKN
jgi:hypothetical protein